MTGPSDRAVEAARVAFMRPGTHDAALDAALAAAYPVIVGEIVEALRAAPDIYDDTRPDEIIDRIEREFG